jgi:hypothetical protein
MSRFNLTLLWIAMIINGAIAVSEHRQLVSLQKHVCRGVVFDSCIKLMEQEKF